MKKSVLDNNFKILQSKKKKGLKKIEEYEDQISKYEK